MYSGYGIAFDQKGTWNFGNDRTRNVIIFGNNNSSSSHTDNCKNDLLVLREGYSFVTNRSFCAQKKKFSIKIQNFCLSLYYSGDNIFACSLERSL